MDHTSLPPELLSIPQPLIGFVGLGITENAVHKSIWNAFTNNRKSDRVAVQFTLFSTNYEFPVAKPKRQSYEWYHPKGILKRNWLHKHLRVLPAVVVLFMEMEWNDSQWSEKQLHCASLIQTLKNMLQGRNTRFAVVLLQKGAPLPTGEDLIASERASTLTSACGINAKTLFVFPYNDHLLGYTIRLESAFLEMAQSYYAQMSKQIRMHRDQLTGSHHKLKIRHQFKLGFLSEIRLDYNTALKHYMQAYSNLEDIRIPDNNCLEIKTISGFLNFKICKLKFKLNAPRDSITLFKAHIDKYKSQVGFKELLFEHYAWLSVQYSSFADTFCEAIKNGLPALQIQHPGIYYQKASEYLAKRKEAFFQCALNAPKIDSQNADNSNSDVLVSDFFGIRTIKGGKPSTDQEIIILVHGNEKNFNHSAAIISLLGQAMAQFKVYKCLRFRKKLATDMAEEYFKCNDHTKALTLYSLMLSDFRDDKWFKIFTEVLMKTLKSAYLSASLMDFISCSVEILSPHIKCDEKFRVFVLENMWKVLQNTPPISQTPMSPALKSNWEKALVTFKYPIKVDLNKISEIFESVISFETPRIQYGGEILIKLYIRSLTIIPLKIKSISIDLTDLKQVIQIQADKYYIFDTIDDLRKSELENQSSMDYLHFDSEFKLEPNKYYKFYFRTESQLFLENLELQVGCFRIEVGVEGRYVMLTKCAQIKPKNIFYHYNRHKDFINNINCISSCYIVPIFHLKVINYQNVQPMLTNEYFKVIISVTNMFETSLQKVGISISIPSNLINKVFLTNNLTYPRQKLLTNIQIDVGEIKSQDNIYLSYYVFSQYEGNIELQQKVWYHLEAKKDNRLQNDSDNDNNSNKSNANKTEDDSPTNNAGTTLSNSILTRQLSGNIHIDYVDENWLRKTQEDTITLLCSPEFKFIGKFFTLNKSNLTTIYCGEDFLFRAFIEVMTPCNIDVLETCFICDPNVSQSLYSSKRKKHTRTYTNGEVIEDVYLLRTKSIKSDWMQKSAATSTEVPNSQKSSEIGKRKKKKSQSDCKLIITGENVNTTIDKSLLIPTNGIPNKNKIKENNNIGIKNMTISQYDDKKLQWQHENGLLKNTITTNPGMTILPTQLLQTSSSSSTSLSSSVAAVATAAVSLATAAPTSASAPSSSSSLLANDVNKFKYIYNNVSSYQEMMNYRYLDNMQKYSTCGNDVSLIPSFGLFCIKWKRTDSDDENESKFFITGVPARKPTLNIHCMIEEHTYVKSPLALRITLKNSSAKVLYLTASLNNTNNFMCSGHKQINISIFPYSEVQIVFNLYVFKAGWQMLPELTLSYNSTIESDQDLQSELYELVQRTMPKKVFILPGRKDDCIHTK